MRSRQTIRVLLYFILAASLCAQARADDLKLSATLGIGGRYRPNTWLPVTVSIINTGTDTVHGQLHLYAADPGGRDTGSLFARPVDIAAGPSPQSFQVYVRDLDPGRDDLIVRVVDGSERGDGRVLAKADALSTSGRKVFSGVPITEDDLLLVGVSADSSAFNFLNGQSLGLIHNGSGITAEAAHSGVKTWPGNRFAPPRRGLATAQVADAAPAELPDKAAGYGGVDAVLLRADVPLDSLTEAQTDALKAWVASGGHLVVCGGGDPTPFSNAFFAGLLPASVGPASSMAVPFGGSAPALRLTPKPLPGVRTIPGTSSSAPLGVTGPYGAGLVTLLAFDPALPAFAANRPAVAAFWKNTLSTGPSSLLRIVAAREEGYGNRYYGWGGTQVQMSDAVMRAPALDAPGAGVIGLFLLGYVLILVPINYLVLKRLDKKEWAWATIPAIVVLVAAATYGVGYAAKGSSVFVNRASVLETTAGERQAGVFAEIGLFSPHRTTYDLTVADSNALAAIPQSPDDNGYYGGPYGRRSSSPNSYGQTRFVEGAAGTKMQDAAVNMWAMRAFDVQTTTDLGGVIASTLVADPKTGAINGGLTNHTPHRLTDCLLCYRGRWSTVPDMPSGVNTHVVTPPSLMPSTAPNAATIWSQMPTISGRNDKNDPESDIRQRMRAALAGFARDLGSDPTNGQSYGGNLAPPAFFEPMPGEAILTGWCSDDALAGPPVSVDGHPVTENSVTFVVVHIPLR